MSFRGLLLGTTAYTKWASPAFQVAARVALERLVHRIPMDSAAAAAALDTIAVCQALDRAVLFLPHHRPVTVEQIRPKARAA